MRSNRGKFQSFYLKFSVFFIYISTAASNDYQVPSFSTSDRSIPQESNRYIDPPQKDTPLTQIDTIPDTLAPGELLLRRRFGAEEYSLYVGKISEYARTKEANFFIYSFPEGLTIDSIALLKFYDDKHENPNADLENVYFDNERIYIEKLSKIFNYIGDEWKSLTALNAITIEKKKTGDLSITTNPLGAKLTIDGLDSTFVTPCLVTGLKPGTYAITANLPDYEMNTQKIEITADSVSQAQLNMKSAIGLENKFSISLLFNINRFLNIFTESSDDKIAAAFKSNKTVTNWSTPSQHLGSGILVQLNYRLRNRLWINSRIQFVRTQNALTMFMKDTGSVERYYRKNVSEERNSIIGVSAGLGIEIVRTPVYRLSLSTLPSYAYILKKITGSDTSDFEKPEYGNNKNLLGFISTKTSGSYETAIKGSAYGFDISMDNRIFVKKAISVDLQIGVQSLFAPSLSGKTKYRHRSATSTLMSGNVVIDTSWTDYATALKGNVYGTGDIVFYDDPDAIDFEAKRTAVEFSTVYIRFGLSFYF